MVKQSIKEGQSIIYDPTRIQLFNFYTPAVMDKTKRWNKKCDTRNILYDKRYRNWFKIYLVRQGVNCGLLLSKLGTGGTAGDIVASSFFCV